MKLDQLGRLDHVAVTLICVVPVTQNAIVVQRGHTRALATPQLARV